MPCAFTSAGLPIGVQVHGRPSPRRRAKAGGARESATDGPKRPRCKQKGNTAYESPEPIIIGVSHQIGHYADALRVPAGYEQIIPREHRG